MLVPFHVTHLDAVVNRDVPHRDQVVLEWIRHHIEGPAMTGMFDGRVLGCAGLVFSWPGFATAWMILGEEIGPHGVWLTRTVRRVLQDWIRAYGLYRVEAMALQESARNQDWLVALGFQRENGCARVYTPDRRNMIRYEWVKE